MKVKYSDEEMEIGFVRFLRRIALFKGENQISVLRFHVNGL